MASAKVLYDKLDFGFCMIWKRSLRDSILDDEKRLREILDETRSRSQMRLDERSHTAAVARATSYFSARLLLQRHAPAASDYYQFLEQAVRRLETERGIRLIGRLKDVCGGALYSGQPDW